MKRLLNFLFTIIIVSGSNNILAQKKKPIEYVFPESAFSGLKYRMVGPFRGGRSTAVEGIPDKPFTFFMGATGGGVWKTDDAGTSWENVSDGFFATGSIGSIEVTGDQNVIYVGTGSACIRGNIIIGKGMYKSVDGGDTWEKKGLINAGQIGRVITHPKNPDLVYVAALGNPFGRNTERGVYRSKDGGSNWEKILFHSDSVGAIDIEMDPNNPRILFAGMWRAERKPWTLIDGSSEGGLFKSSDGGDNWIKITNGLPKGIIGKIDITISPVNSDRIWVIQEAQDEKEGGIYRSDDGGKSFKRINRDHNLRQRAWYYTHIFADPQNENTVFVTNTSFYKSIDGGESFARIQTLHGDNHDLWINPTNSNIMIESNDGGAHVSLNGGESWSTLYNQPTAEFYRLTIDNQFPYRIYAAQQDNTTISIPSIMPGGITPKQYWYPVGGGESGHIAVHPDNPDLIYSGNYIGQILRVDRKNNHTRNVVMYPQMHDGTAPRDIAHRFQWNAPIRISQHNADVLYHCSQYVHKSINGGQSWEIISPDLTTNKDIYQDIPGSPVQHDHTGVELYTTIFSFEESPHNPGELWAGTDDGRLHISKDGGNSWGEITPPDIPYEGTINTIELSKHAPGRAYISVYKYRENDFKPYIFFTEDFGKSWESLATSNNGIPADHFVRVTREDPNRKGLLYAGTEFGMYISFNNGTSWQSFQLNLPITSIADMQIKNNDLVVATHGRSFWILDDITPLYELSKDALTENVKFFKPGTTYRTQLRGGFRDSDAPDRKEYGAQLYFYLKDLPDSLSLDIIDSKGNKITTYASYKIEERDKKLELVRGLNKVVWPLNGEKPNLISGSYMSLAYTGPMSVAPGMYSAVLTVDGNEFKQSITVEKDPRWVDISNEDLQKQYELTFEILQKLNQTHDLIFEIRNIREQSDNISMLAEKAGYSKEISKVTKSLSEKLTSIEELLIQTKNESGQDPINYPPMLDDQFAYLYSTINFQDALPSEGSYKRLEDLKTELDLIIEKFNEIKSGEYQMFLGVLKAENVSPVIIPKRK